MQRYMKQGLMQLFVTLGVFGLIGAVFAWTAPTTAPTDGAGALQVNGGNIGIGKNPTAKLDVNGTAKATAFIGDGSGLTNLPSGAIPSGMIAMFDAACPLGWTRFGALDGRFPRGNSVYGGMGGSTQTDNGVWPIPYGAGNGAGSSPRYTIGPHYHNVSPLYLDVIWCKKN